MDGKSTQTDSMPTMQAVRLGSQEMNIITQTILIGIIIPAIIGGAWAYRPRWLRLRRRNTRNARRVSKFPVEFWRKMGVM